MTGITPSTATKPGMDVLSPRSTNVPMKLRTEMKKAAVETKARAEEKPTNPDRIDDKWRPPSLVSEPGLGAEIYVIGKKLGKGGFAVCFEGKTKTKSEAFALKVVKSRIEQKKMAEKFRTELQIHAKMCHPNIVEFHRAFTFEDHTYVVLELCENGNLTDMVKSRECLSLPEVRRFMVQICGGVKYMHKRSVIHRDLKMGNIFLDSHMNLKIGDFGLAAVMVDEQDRRTTLCGTPNYIAPEILSKSGSRGHDNKVDTWAVGVICFAMLMGTPPFQSKTQQEIYSKLKNLDYEWKIDSKNYIPQQAKDFVASCLTLVSAERPEMDELVQHEFFKMGAVADQLDATALGKEPPQWLLKADPRGDRVRPGYGISHTQICRECGVGRTLDGRSRPAVGEKADISTLREIEVENQNGCAPTVPLGDGVLYKQFEAARDEWKQTQKRALLPTRPRGKKTTAPDSRSNIIGDELEVVETRPAPPAVAAPRPLPVKTVQSFAAQQRQQAASSRPPPMLVRPDKQPPNSPEPQNPGKDESMPPPSRGYLRERPVRAASVRLTRSTSTRAISIEKQKTLPKSSTISGGTDSLASGENEATSPDEPISRKTATVRTASKTGSLVRIASRSGEEVVDQAPLSKLSSSEAPEGVLRPTSGNDRAPSKDFQPKEVYAEKLLSSSTSLGAPSKIPAQKSHVISPSDPYKILPGSGPGDALSTLRAMYDGLSSSAKVPKSSSKSSWKHHSRLPPHPRVEKWVDYTARHGIAYILTGGTVGVVLKSSDDNSRTTSCIVLRDAQKHALARAKGTEEQIVPQGASNSVVEFYERCGDEGVRALKVPNRNFKLDLKRAKGDEKAAIAKLQESCVDDCESERVRMVVLADKFGKYMNKINAVSEDPEEPINSDKRFVNFYQRLGNVGIWRFDDGGLQVNFPDHTKIVVYGGDDADGQWTLDVVHLHPRDAELYTEHEAVSAAGLARRDILTILAGEVMQSSRAGTLAPEVREILNCNQIREKLRWLRAVVGYWLQEGGIGRMGCHDKLGWDSRLNDKKGKDDVQRPAAKGKMVWVCVGREGGDGSGESEKATDTIRGSLKEV